MKDKLYDFLDKRRLIIYSSSIVLLLFAQRNIDRNQTLVQASVLAFIPFMLAIFFLTFVDDSKSRQRLPSQPASDPFTEVVEELAERTRQSKSEVLRHALNLYYRVAMLDEQERLSLQSLIEDCEKKRGINWSNHHKEVK